MAISVNDTTAKKGLVQFYEKELGMDYGDVSGDSELLAEFIARVNITLDDYLLLWAKASGTWQGDDINHGDLPIITRNIVSGTRDYDFISDGSSNRIVDLQKVLILPSATATRYEEITPIDELNVTFSEILTATTQGRPTQYGKLANAIFLDLIPNYSVSAGIKMIVNREGSYATTSDTTKVMGVPAYHEFFYLKPAMEKARIKGLPQFQALKEKVEELEGDEARGLDGKILEFFNRREKDTVTILSGEFQNYE